MLELEDGHLLGRYRIETFLAEGGMGRVYRALDTMLGRRVALKVLTTDEAPGSPTIARLVRGARAAAAFSHPNVCSVFDAGEVDGQPFIAMELVEGTSLRARIADPDVDAVQRLRWVLDLAGALAVAHRARVVHRDIKPDNVMIDADGRVRLLDFGIATWEDGSSAEPGSPGPAAGGEFRTEAGHVVGTRAYMAPEQLEGRPVDARTDQFAWGVLAYETLGGRHPFPATDEFRTPPLLSTLCPGLPFGVAAIVAKAMALDPAQRFADMSELVGQLGPLVPGATVAAPEGGPAPRRQRIVRALGAVALLAALSGAGRILWARDAAPPAGAAVLAIAHPRRVTFGATCDEFPSFTRDGRTLIYSGSDLAGNFRIYQVELDRPAPPRVIVHADQDGWDLGPVVSPRGDRVAFLRMNKDAAATMIAPIDGSAPPRAIGAPGMYPRWSHDGRGIWTGNGRTIALHDADSGAILRTLALPGELRATWMFERADGSIVAHINHGGPSNPTGLAWFAADGGLRWRIDAQLEPALAPSPDGDHVIASRQRFDGQAELVAIPLDGSPIVSLSSTGVVARDGMAISADGKRLAWSSCHPVPHVSALDAAGRFVPVMIGEGADALGLAGIPGSHDLAVASGRTGTLRLWIMDRTGKRPPRPVAAGDRPVRDVAISPDGAHFVVVLEGAGLGVGSLADEDGFRMLTDNPGDSAPGFRPGGDVVFTRRLPDGPSQVMVAAPGGPATALLERTSHDAAVSPTDGRIAYLAGESTATPMLADPAGRSPRPLSPELGPGRYRQLRFSPDGRRVALVRGDRELVEVDAARGSVIRTAAAESGDALYNPTYADDGLVVLRAHWEGNVWVADAAFGAAAHEPAPPGR